MPDLMVIGKEELHLAEVKFRAGSVRRGYQRIPIGDWDLARYQKYWPEAVLIVVSPFRDGFHAQQVSNLSSRGDLSDTTEFSYDAFEPIDAIFKQALGRDLALFSQGIENLGSFWEASPKYRRYLRRRGGDR